jgi:EXLDI family protein
MCIHIIYAYYTYMANRTIYVSDADEQVFEKAKDIAGEGLSGVIARALREYVIRHDKNNEHLKEINVKIGSHSAEREQRFMGKELHTWRGFDDDREWWLEARIFITKNSQWAINLKQICRASLLLDKKQWKADGEYLLNPTSSQLFVAKSISELTGKIPSELLHTLEDLENKDQHPIEYLDI